MSVAARAVKSSRICLIASFKIWTMFKNSMTAYACAFDRSKIDMVKNAQCPLWVQEQTFCTVARMSGLSLKADATEADRHAQFVPKRTFGRFYSITLSAGEPVSMRIQRPIQHPPLKTLNGGSAVP